MFIHFIFRAVLQGFGKRGRPAGDNAQVNELRTIDASRVFIHSVFRAILLRFRQEESTRGLCNMKVNEIGTR